MLIVVAVLMGSAPVEAKLRKVALGVSMPEGNHDIAVLQDFTADAGGIRPAIWTLWSTWGKDSTKEFPTQMANEVWAKGSTVLLFWEPGSKDRFDCTFSRHREIAAGTHDAYLTRWAQAAKSYGHPVLLRYAHEINGNYFSWGTSQCGNTVKAYKKGWRHIHDIFRKVGARNVKFLWTVAKHECRGRGCNPYANYYPGNRYVDYAGFSSFNWGAQKSWKSMLHVVRGTMGFFREFTSKPVIVAELATNSLGGNKPRWIRDGYPAVYKAFPTIKAIVYLNVDLSKCCGHPDWSLNTPSPGAFNAYKEVASNRKFKGRIR